MTSPTPIIRKPGDLIRVEPTDSPGICYLLRVPTVQDRVRFFHEVRRAGVAYWSEMQMLDMLAEGIRFIMNQPEDEQLREGLLAEIEAHKARIVEFGQEWIQGVITPESDAVAFLKRWAETITPSPRLREVERTVSAAYQPYADRVADREVYDLQCGLVAARLFLDGWEGVDGEFRRNRDRTAAEETLGRITNEHYNLIGAQARNMLEPPMERLKKLASPGGGSPAQATSPEASTPPPSDPSSTTGGQETVSDSTESA